MRIQKSNTGNGSVTECRDKEMSYIPDQILEMVSLSETGEYEDFPTGPMGMGYFVLWVNETGMLLTVKTPANEDNMDGRILKALSGLEME